MDKVRMIARMGLNMHVIIDASRFSCCQPYLVTATRTRPSATPLDGSAPLGTDQPRERNGTGP
eukprot:2498132-Karenia_brevis.AAC.1